MQVCWKGGLCYQSAPLLRAAIISPSPRMRGGVRVRWNWHLVLTSSLSQRDISETGSGYQEHYTTSWRAPVFRCVLSRARTTSCCARRVQSSSTRHDPPDSVPPRSPALIIQTISTSSLAHEGEDKPAPDSPRGEREGSARMFGAHEAEKEKRMLAVVLAAWQAGRPDLIRSPRLVLAYVWVGMEF